MQEVTGSSPVSPTAKPLFRALSGSEQIGESVEVAPSVYTTDRKRYQNDRSKPSVEHLELTTFTVFYNVTIEPTTGVMSCSCGAFLCAHTTAVTERLRNQGWRGSLRFRAVDRACRWFAEFAGHALTPVAIGVDA